MDSKFIEIGLAFEKMGLDEFVRKWLIRKCPSPAKPSK
jgi:hypothetical protein